ncbi:MAG: hypothetical protein QN121_09155 [Armatimonadota bacterium]|nr:hypothetical protein [Armatimonadota bacterium]
MRQKSGYTTIELLITMTILLLIVAMVGTFLWASQREWELADRQVEILHNARIVLEIVLRDVRRIQRLERIDTDTDMGRLCYVVIREDGIEELREVRYDGQNLLLQSGLPTQRLCTFAPGSEVDILSGQVISFRLTALNEENSPVRDPSPGQLDKIRSVRIQITVQDPERIVPAVTFASQAALRIDGSGR